MQNLTQRAEVEGSDFKIVESPTPKSKIDGKTLISKFSFTHIVEQLNIEDATNAVFTKLNALGYLVRAGIEAAD